MAYRYVKGAINVSNGSIGHTSMHTTNAVADIAI